MDNSLREAVKATLEISAYFEMIRDNSPEQVFGTSTDGLVEVTIDRNGKLIDCQIAEDWNQSVESEQLQANLNEALSNAQNFRMEHAGEEIEKQGLPDPEVSEEDITRMAELQQSEIQNSSSFYLPREPDVLGEDIVALLDQRLAQQPTRPKVATVQLEGTYGLTSEILLNSEWAGRRGGSIIAGAIVLAANNPHQDIEDPAKKLMAESLGLLSKWSK